MCLHSIPFHRVRSSFARQFSSTQYSCVDERIRCVCVCVCWWDFWAIFISPPIHSTIIHRCLNRGLPDSVHHIHLSSIPSTSRVCFLSTSTLFVVYSRLLLNVCELQNCLLLSDYIVWFFWYLWICRSDSLYFRTQLNILRNIHSYIACVIREKHQGE